jgi:hypothetical protein
MPAQQRRLPITTGIALPPLQISPAAWLRIEKAYGCKIRPAVRDRIERLTIKYLRLASMEHAAAPLQSARVNVATIRKPAEKLLTKLKAVQDCDSDVHSFVGHIIRQNLKLSSRRPLGDDLGGFVGDLEKLVAVLARIDVSEAPDAQQNGQAWPSWARDIRAVVKEAGLPHGVSKDTMRSASDSAFVRLVAALQLECPLGYRPFTQTRALADAIYRAARAGGFSKARKAR